MSWDDFGLDLGDVDGEDWSTILSGYDFDTDLYYDTDLGDFVDPSTVNPSDVVDYDFGDLPVPETPSSTSTSDMLRSIQGAPAGTLAPGQEPFDWNAMADPSASIASAQDGGWGKMLAQGLSSALGALGGTQGGLGSLARSEAGAGGPVSGGVGLMNAQPFSPGGMMSAQTFSPGSLAAQTVSPGGLMGADTGGISGLGGLARMGNTDPVQAALMQLQASGGPWARQGPLDTPPAPAPFTPLVLPPVAPPMAPVAQGGPRMSGLQRLLQERVG